MGWLTGLFGKDKSKAEKQGPEKEKKPESLSPEERQRLLGDILELSLVICDGDQEFHKTMQDILELPIDEFLEKYQELSDETDLWDFMAVFNPGDDMEPESFVVACVRALGFYGFVSSNDVKFTIADMLYNFERAFSHCGIPGALFAEIPDKEDLMIWEHVNLVAKALPSEWRLLNWQIDGDEYNFFLLREERVPALYEIYERLGGLKNLKLNVIDPEKGFGG